MLSNTVSRQRRYLSLKRIKRAWAAEWNNRTFRRKLLLTPGLFIVYSSATQHIANFVELRKGIRLHDTLLTLLPTADCSLFIFLLLYSSMLLFVAAHLRRPNTVLRILEMHLIVALIRQLCIIMIPLEPPAGILVLRDVFLENTVYPHHVPMTKDLFFSGHVASIWIYFLCAERRYLKMYLGCATILMSLMVLMMRVHYSYDVYGAILFTSLAYAGTSYLRRRKDKTVREAKPVPASI